MAEPIVTVEVDHPKHVGTGRPEQTGSYYIHYVRDNVLNPLHTVIHLILPKLGEAGKMYSFRFTVEENGTQRG